MLLLNNILHWISIRFFILYRWQERNDIRFDIVGIFFNNLGKKIYPDAYCYRCGTFIYPGASMDYEDGYVFNGLTDKKLEHPACSNCYQSPTKKQLDMYHKWRVKHPLNYRQ